MQVPAIAVDNEISEIKKLYNIKYLTRTDCRTIAGWSWSKIQNRWSSARGAYYIVSFYTSEAETYYRLKWTE